MKKEIIAIAAIAVISGMALASCGREVQQDTVTVDLPKVTAASDEQTTTATGTTTTGTKTTTTTSSGSTTTTTSTAEEDEDTDTTTTATKEEKTEPTTAAEPAEKPTDAHVNVNSAYSFSYGDLLSSSAISSLGTPNYKGTSPACTTSGSDITVYEYNGVTIQSYDNGGSEAICSIVITSSNYSTGGVTIGSSRSDVISAFGGDGSFYSDGPKELTFYYDGDSVSSIQFYYPA